MSRSMYLRDTVLNNYIFDLWTAVKSKLKAENQNSDKLTYKLFHEITEYGWEIGYKMALKNIKEVIDDTSSSSVNKINKIKIIFEDSFGSTLVYNCLGLDFDIDVCENFILQDYHSKETKINFDNISEQSEETLIYPQKEFEQEMWKSVKTFSDVCFLGSLWCQNLIKVQPRYGLTINKHNLYEFDNDNLRKYINIMANINKLGFYTTMSQPGSISQSDQLKNNKIVEYRQRANIGGFVKLSTFLKLLSLVNNEDSLVMIYCPFGNVVPDDKLKLEELSQNKSHIFFCEGSLENRLISATFVDKKFPLDVYSSEIYEQNFTDNDDIYYSHTNFCVGRIHIDEHIDISLVDSDDVYEVSIIDKNWGDNILWEKLLNQLQS